MLVKDKAQRNKKYGKRGDSFRIKIGAGMKAGKRRSYKYPGMEALCTVDEWCKKSKQQVQENNAPVFSDLDEHFYEMCLDIIAANNKWNRKKDGAASQPD